MIGSLGETRGECVECEKDGSMIDDYVPGVECDFCRAGPMGRGSLRMNNSGVFGQAAKISTVIVSSKAATQLQVGGSVKDDSVSPVIDLLIPIWQRVLQRTSIQVEDNFFDLGGNPSLAARLFSEIATASGRHLAPVVIYQAPTIRALAGILERSTPVRLPPIVLLKAGTAGPPIFIAPGMGSNVLGLFELVRHIGVANSIYGMQATGTDGVDEPFECIEDMAQFHLAAIKELQPHGPYLLIGYSMGGLVTLEIAQRLSENGERVALLAMLDSFPHKRFLRFGQFVRLIARQAKHHASIVMQLPMRQALSYLTHRSERRSPASRDSREKVINRPPMSGPFAPAIESVRDAEDRALTRYRPRFYRGKINFVRAEISTYFPDDAGAVWADLADEFELETVPGDHRSMLTAHVESLASVLSRYLREVSDLG
jgi:thioesterase domain-containing protein